MHLMANEARSTGWFKRMLVKYTVRVSPEGLPAEASKNTCFSETSRTGSNQMVMWLKLFLMFWSRETRSSFWVWIGLPASLIASVPSSVIVHAFARSVPLPPKPRVINVSVNC